VKRLQARIPLSKTKPTSFILHQKLEVVQLPQIHLQLGLRHLLFFGGKLLRKSNPDRPATGGKVAIDSAFQKPSRLSAPLNYKEHSMAWAIVQYTMIRKHLNTGSKFAKLSHLCGYSFRAPMYTC
jgi:hypothetical protein